MSARIPFVTARVVGDEVTDSDGSYMIRQGLLIGYAVLGESGNSYQLTQQRDYIIVPDVNLWGSTLGFVEQLRSTQQ